jgi:hypothetical protein
VRASAARAGVVIAGAAILVAITGCGRTQPSQPGSTEPQVARNASTPLVLFFVGEDGRLRRETRDVPELPEAPQARARLVLEELLAGSRQGLLSPLPWAAAVQAVFIDREGNAYVDLSPPSEPAIAGTSAELAFVYSVVNTVVANCPGVHRVQVLFGGKEIESYGNIALSRPLPPGLDVVAP